jgi:hypothetical protein
LIFVAGTEAKANDIAETIVKQLRSGGVNITMMGKLTSVIEEVATKR